jgi:hypothetical protein
MASSMTLPTAGRDDFDLPTAPGTLRETFDLPLLGEDTSSPPIGLVPEADPMALLREEPAPRRKPMAAEARAQARRCPTCGGVVPRGMSLCSTCGLDLESGQRIDLTEDLTMPAPIRRQEVPIAAWIVGGLTIFASVLFAIISLIQWSRGETGFIFLLVVCLFGVYAAVQFLRARSLKLIIIALTLGVAVDIVVMIILPVVVALSDVQVNEAAPGEDGPVIHSVNERLDQNKLTWGIMIVVSYAALALYLNSPPVRRRFH